MSHDNIFTVTEIVHPLGDSTPFETGVLLAAFNSANEANAFARAHSDEIELEMKADIKADVERHLLRMTGKRFFAQVENEQLLLCVQKEEGSDYPNSDAKLQIRTCIQELFWRTYPEYSKRNVLVDRESKPLAMNTKSFTVSSMKTGKSHETVVRKLKVEDMLLYPPIHKEIADGDKGIGERFVGWATEKRPEHDPGMAK